MMLGGARCARNTYTRSLVYPLHLGTASCPCAWPWVGVVGERRGEAERVHVGYDFQDPGVDRVCVVDYDPRGEIRVEMTSFWPRR